ncbi:hypothetical protein [Streptomyces silvisoli]|uniref:Endonuclease/exonuclease/phosphatase domain-containing protein n=1 Tax=Streptomyces silvisoli TaxID=3034235 RepID=A0ABT5ZK10_9ACTN|nr:hypothetical protein [Streptomyces silvisoli]MDF3290137.1 hypothetical protein [Streptomyces silvisoli]
MHAHRTLRRGGADVPVPGRLRRLRSLAGLLTAFLLACAGLIASSGTAQAAPDDHTMATWNMNQSPDDWRDAYNIARVHDVVALQEVPIRVPAGAVRQPDVNGVEHYLWQEGTRGPERHLYILRPGGSVRNMGMITSWEPDDVFNIPSVNRPALAVLNRADDILIASLHARTRGGSDVGALLQRIEFAAARSNVGHWAALGDYNRAPATIRQLTYQPANMHIYNPGRPTHRSGGEWDYMITNFTTDRFQATVDTGRLSDHWPVYFHALQAAAGPTPFSMEAENSHLLLRAAGNTPENGAHVYQSQDDFATHSRWILRSINRINWLGQELYRIENLSDSNLCMDVEFGQQSHVGDYLNITTCHKVDGSPEPGGYLRDTQNFTLDHPDPLFPNLTMLHDNATGLYASILGNSTRDGAGAVQDRYHTHQWPDPDANETFYLHPIPTT